MTKSTHGPRRNKQRHAHTTGSSLNFVKGGGEMGALIRAKDWSKTPLGPIELWPQSLRTTVDICQASDLPICIIWGSELVQIYNDGYRMICGDKHPHSMGQNFPECWREAWPVIGEAHASALAGDTAFLENQHIFLDRHGYTEECFFTFSFSPIRDEAGRVGGLFHPVIEMTAKMLGERRTRTLRDVAARTAKAKTVEEACRLAVQSLADHGLDIPFVLLYLFDAGDTSARLVASTGLPAGTVASPERIMTVPASAQPWPLAEVANQGQPQLVDDLEGRFGHLSCGPYPESPRGAIALPLTPPGSERPTGVLIAGMSSRLKLNQAYRDFYELLAVAVSAAVANGRAFEEERNRAEALAELDRAKTAFFSNISHEFRTPLTLLLGPTEDMLAMKHGVLSRDATEQIELIHRSALRLQKLVNTLLDFSRTEAGRAQASYVETELGAWTEDLASMFRSAMEKAGLKFTVDCPPLSEPVFVDRDMWEKIVFNLLSNAFKFTLKGTVDVRLRTVAMGTDGMISPTPTGFVELSVRDTGIGIPTQELSKIFTRFYRIEGRQGRSHEGTGIGLALIQELVKLHCGTIDVESEPGRGTVFYVRVPHGKKHLPADRIGFARTAVSTALPSDAFVEEALMWLPEESRAAACGHGSKTLAAPGLDRPRVLLADDNADMRNYVERFLLASYDVEAVSNGRAALEAARKYPPHLIVSDVMMPDMNGFELVQQLRADDNLRSIPIILLSARAGEEARIEGVSQGADDYITKPFSARELLARVATHLELARVRQAASEGVRQSDTALRESEERLRQTNTELVQRVAEVQKANVEVQQARRAALNLMEDAVQSRHAVERLNLQLLESASQLRAFTGQLEHLVKERTEELEQSGDRLRALAKDLTIAEQSERRRLATELHDYLAQLLVVTRMKVGQLLGQDQDAETRTLLKDADQFLLQSLDYTRSLVSELIPQALYERGLSAALRWLGDQMRRQRVMNVEITLDSPELPLPETDTVLLFHSIRELLFNVLKHAKTDQVSVSMQYAQDVLSITVSDQGCGFDAAKLRDDWSDRFGLLSIRERMTALGGRFDLFSAPGKGTVASLHLPFKASGERIETQGAGGEGRVPSISVMSEDPPAPNSTLTLPGEANVVTPLRVLIVDDHHLVREGLRSVLEEYGDITVIGEASTGEQALQIVCSLNPEVVLMDMQMPGWNGVESTSRLLKERPSTVVIGLSIQNDSHIAQSMLDAGASAFLTKDVAVNELYATLRAAVRQRTASRSLTSCPPAEGLAAGQR